MTYNKSITIRLLKAPALGGPGAFESWWPPHGRNPEYVPRRIGTFSIWMTFFRGSDNHNLWSIVGYKNVPIVRHDCDVKYFSWSAVSNDTFYHEWKDVGTSQTAGQQMLHHMLNSRLEFHILAGSGARHFWVNGAQNSCVKVPPVKCHGISNYMRKW